MNIQQLTLDEALNELNQTKEQLAECAQARRALLKENIQLRKDLADKDRILEEIGKQLEETQRQLTDFTWHKRLKAVSFKKCSTPEKQIIEHLRDLHCAVPHTGQGDFQVRLKTIVEATGMSKRTVINHMDAMEEKGFISRRYEGNGKHGDEHRDNLFVKVDERIINNPTIIQRIVPVERTENRGGARKKGQGQTEMECPNCHSTRTRGDRHDSGICDDCQRPFDVWVEFPITPLSEPADVRIEERVPDEPTDDPFMIEVPAHLRGKTCPSHGVSYSQVGWNEWDGSPRFGCAICEKAQVSA